LRQERISDDKKELLMHSAINEFVERGFEKASYNKIIERSGLSKGTVYYYFENKESLLKMVLNEIVEQFIAISDELEVPKTIDEFWQVDCEYHRRTVNLLFESPCPSLLCMLFSNDSTLNKEIANIIEPTLCYRHKHITRGQDLGAVRNDMSAETISMIILEIGRVLSNSMIKNKEDDENNPKVRDDVIKFVEIMRDLSIRILTPSNK
jgi:AcrR family transcriptional regulator